MRKYHIVPPQKEKSSVRFQRIYETVRERICLLQYPPGTVLNEAELSAEFAVSRTPLRRVLQKLNYEGLVEITNGVGTIVTDIDMKTFKDIYDLRMLLAESMGRLSTKAMTEHHINEIDTLIERTKTLSTKVDIELYARIANDLEKVILDLIGSKPLREMTDTLYYRVSRIWLTFLPNLDWQKVVNYQLTELQQMRKALIENDIQAFGRVRSQQLQGILDNISSYLTGR